MKMVEIEVTVDNGFNMEVIKDLCEQGRITFEDGLYLIKIFVDGELLIVRKRLLMVTCLNNDSSITYITEVNLEYAKQLEVFKS